MQKLKRWLFDVETTLYGKLANISLTFIVDFLWNVGILALYGILFATKQFDTPEFKHQTAIYFIEACVFAPLWEEMIFRKLIIDVFSVWEKGKFLFATIFASSIIWSMGHSLGIWAIPVQGVSGLLYSALYLKNGKSYWSVVTVHFLWNFLLTVHAIG